jgi:DNA-binding XRE family transcriptional regulator
LLSSVKVSCEGSLGLPWFPAASTPGFCSLCLSKQVAQGKVEPIGHLFCDIEPEADFAQLDQADIRAMDPRKRGEFLLGKATPFATATDNSTKHFADGIGHEVYFFVLQTECLQTSVCKNGMVNGVAEAHAAVGCRGAPMTFGERQAELRKKTGMTQEQLAVGSGISIWTLRGYEQNHRDPNWKAALKVAKALGVTLEAFADCISQHDDDDHQNARQPNLRRPSRRQGRKAAK